MRILGLDPGLQVAGYGVIALQRDQRLRLVEGGVLRTDPKALLERRLQSLYTDATALFAEFTPDAVAVEALYSHYEHPRTAIVMGHARGVLLLAAAVAGLSIASYAAARIKKALTGNGHASKSQVGRAVAHELGLEVPPEPADVTDALAVALCHANVLTHTGSEPLPGGHGP